MRQVIGGKLYDTETAEQLHDWDNGRGFGPRDFKWRAKTLYRTPKGALFIHHQGGALTDMQAPCGNNEYTGSEQIEPVSREDAVGFLETHGGTEVLLEEFPEAVKEA